MQCSACHGRVHLMCVAILLPHTHARVIIFYVYISTMTDDDAHLGRMCRHAGAAMRALSLALRPVVTHHRRAICKRQNPAVTPILFVPFMER